jgi:hypothetical protein
MKKTKTSKPGWIEQFDEGYRQFWKKRGIEIPSAPDHSKLFLNPNKLKKKRCDSGRM